MILVAGGNDITLSCTLLEDDGDVNTDYLIAWYYNNAPTSSNETLHLSRVGLSDGGWYTCATSSAVERYELDFLLVVGGEMMITVCETTVTTQWKYYGLCILTES